LYYYNEKEVFDICDYNCKINNFDRVFNFYSCFITSYYNNNYYIYIDIDNNFKLWSNFSNCKYFFQCIDLYKYLFHVSEILI